MNIKTFIENWAYDDWHNGKPLDPNDYNEFAKICREEGGKPTRELFDFYFECYNSFS